MMSAKPPASGQLVFWWVYWGAILVALVVVYALFGRAAAKPTTIADLWINLSGIVPLFISVVIRGLVVPRFDSLTRAFPVYFVGVGLAETCGILGIFLGGPYRDSLFLLGVLGVTSYVPLFAKRLLEPKGSGFIPNN